jgi:uncharacterized protein YndB with AHSA1/START domain
MNEVSEYAFVTAPATVRVERLLPGPIERIWAYLTESEKRAKWFAGGEMELRAGGRAQFNFRHAELSPMPEPVPEKYKKKAENGQRMEGRITRCDPPRLLSFTFGSPEGEPPSEVTFELTPRGSKVLLVVTHERLKDREQMLGVSAGWHTHLGILIDHLEGREPRPFWSTHTRLLAEYEERLAAS